MPEKVSSQETDFVLLKYKESFSITRAHYFHVLYPFRDRLKKINVPYQKTQNFLILNLFNRDRKEERENLLDHYYWPHI